MRSNTWLPGTNAADSPKACDRFEVDRLELTAIRATEGKSRHPQLTIQLDRLGIDAQRASMR